jgi:hypothetical protein
VARTTKKAAGIGFSPQPWTRGISYQEGNLPPTAL